MEETGNDDPQVAKQHRIVVSNPAGDEIPPNISASKSRRNVARASKSDVESRNRKASRRRSATHHRNNALGSEAEFMEDGAPNNHQGSSKRTRS